MHILLQRNTAEHTQLGSPKWELERNRVGTKVGTKLAVGNPVNTMVKNKMKWRAINEFSERIMTKEDNEIESLNFTHGTQKTVFPLIETTRWAHYKKKRGVGGFSR